MSWLKVIAFDLLASAAAVLLAPFAAWSANKYTGRTHPFFWWMETPDQKLPGDLNEPAVAAIYARWGWWATATYWLIRNKAYAYSIRFAFRPSDNAFLLCDGPPDVGDDSGVQGRTFFEVIDGSQRAWEFYFVRKIVGSVGVRIRLGYKLQPYFHNPSANWPAKGDRTSPWGQPVLHFSIRSIK